MSSPIRSLRQSRPAAHQPTAQAAASKKSSSASAPPAQTQTARTSQSNAAASSADTTGVATTSVLTKPEQQMIARQFPDAPELSMRLYGPGRDAQTVRPSAVGSRLDVQV